MQFATPNLIICYTTRDLSNGFIVGANVFTPQADGRKNLRVTIMAFHHLFDLIVEIVFKLLLLIHHL